MRFPDCLRSPVAENTYLGYPISQTWTDLALWESFLSQHHVGSILELGTWRGGMALYLAHQALARGARFITVDRDEGQVACLAQIQEAGGEFRALDLFSLEGEREVTEMIRAMPRPRLLLCDDGDKPREWRTFVPLLSEGDFVAVHDWGTEFVNEHLQPSLEMLFAAPCEGTASMTRNFAVNWIRDSQ